MTSSVWRTVVDLPHAAAHSEQGAKLSTPLRIPAEHDLDLADEHQKLVPTCTIRTIYEINLTFIIYPWFSPYPYHLSAFGHGRDAVLFESAAPLSGPLRLSGA